MFSIVMAISNVLSSWLKVDFPLYSKILMCCVASRYCKCVYFFAKGFTYLFSKNTVTQIKTVSFRLGNTSIGSVK